jgi:FdhD protein
MLRKAARMKAPFVVSRTSPTSLSITVAKRLGITLIGYVRRDKFNVYSHPENLASRAAETAQQANGAAASRDLG